MPGIGSSSNRDYIILGPHAQWEKKNDEVPVAIKLSNGQRQEVKKEEFDYISRGFDLSSKGSATKSEYELTAQLEYPDKTLEPVIVKVQVVS